MYFSEKSSDWTNILGSCAVETNEQQTLLVLGIQSGFESVAYHGSFLSEFCIIVKCQISECSGKYLRNIFQADDPCRDWDYLI